MPGFLCLRLARVPTKGLLQTGVYSFAFSLLINYLAVYALASAGWYNSELIYALVTIEWGALIALLRREGFTLRLCLPSRLTLEQYRSLYSAHRWAGASVILPAAGSIFTLLALCCNSFGSVFLLGDAVVSWDRWAMEWAAGRAAGSGYYPQLLPTNWSLSYVMTQNTDVKMFAKAIMPLFALGTALLMLDMFHKTGQWLWLASVSSYTAILYYFCAPKFISSGYMEVASAFFGFLTFYSLLQMAMSRGLSSSEVLVPVVFASSAFLTKQGGIFILVAALAWLVVYFVRNRRHLSWRLAIAALGLILMLNWWYVVKQWRVSQGVEGTNLRYLTEKIHAGRSYSERWEHAFGLGENKRGIVIAPFVHLAGLIIAVGLGNPLGRVAILGFLLPFYLLWAFFFSYESRTLAIAVPFMGLALACGLATIVGIAARVKRLATAFTSSRIFRLLLSAAVWISILAVLAGPPLLYLLADPPDRFLARLSNGWVLTITQEWKWPFIAAAASVSVLAFCGRRLPLRLNVPVHAALGVCVVSLYSIEATVLDSATLIVQQKEARRAVGIPPLNQLLYDHAQSAGFEGKIATNYFHLRYLPDISKHYAGKLFPNPMPADYLESLQAEPDVRYILFRESYLAPDSVDLIQAESWPTIFSIGGWTLIRMPDQDRGPQ